MRSEVTRVGDVTHVELDARGVARHEGLQRVRIRSPASAPARHAIDAHQQLHLQEDADELALHEARQPGAQAHGEQVDADDGGELQHRVAEQVAGQRAGGQLVDQAAGRDDEDAGEQQQLGQRGAATGMTVGVAVGVP